MKPVFNNKKMSADEVRRAKNTLGLSIPEMAEDMRVGQRTIINWLKDGASSIGSLALRYRLQFPGKKKR